MYVTNSQSNSIYNTIQSSVPKETNSTENVSNNTSSVKKYDFTQISRSDLLQNINSLIKNGAMDLDESSSLVFLMGPKIAVNGDISTNSSSNEIINVFDELRKSIEFNQSIGNTSGTFYDTKALNALNRLQGKTSSINLTV